MNEKPDRADALKCFSEGQWNKNLLGLKVYFKWWRRSKDSHKKKEILETGFIKELSKVPGFVIIETESGGRYSRNISSFWIEDLIIFQEARS